MWSSSLLSVVSSLTAARCIAGSSVSSLCSRKLLVLTDDQVVENGESMKHRVVSKESGPLSIAIDEDGQALMLFFEVSQCRSGRDLLPTYH